MPVKLNCDCEITDSGEFIVSEYCRYCKECNLMQTVHPFGKARLVSHELK